jgi:hypothetical protein
VAAVSALVVLPRGLEVDGAWHREAVLRPATGAVADAVQGDAGGLLPAERVSVLLHRCLVRLGPWEPPTLDQVRLLCAGDRDALALHLRGLTFGDRIDCVVGCPACAGPMDVELSASGLLLPPSQERPASSVAARIGGREVRLRPPAGRDLEEVARLGVGNPGAAARRLVRACVSGPDGAPVDDLGDAEEAEVAARRAELDPQADLEIDMRCSVCGEELRLPFDPAGFLLRELAVEAEALYREVHALALYYHWSERDILELPVSRRRFYLELLADTVPTAGAPA